MSGSGWLPARLVGTEAVAGAGCVPRRTRAGLQALVLLAAAVAAVLWVALASGGSAEPGAGSRAVAAPAVGGQATPALALSAWAPMSASAGANDAAYAAAAAPGGATLVNPAQGLRAGFGRDGVLVSRGGLHVRMRATAVGFGGSLRALAPAAPRVHANRVAYARGGVGEWYANGPLGLEQGFTIAAAPRPVAHGPLTVSMSLSSNAPVALVDHARTLLFGSAARPLLRYTGLVVTDAGGRRLHSWLALGAGTLLLRADVRGARYPLRIDPFIQQGSKLVGGEETGAGEAGAGVALSADGNTAIVGGPGDGGGIGAAWIFTRTGSSWAQQGPKLTGTGESGNGRFGFRVALSSDGNTAIVGAPEDASGVGAAFVFTRTGSTWEQQGAKLTGSGETGKGEFGIGVALGGAEGSTALVGGSADKAGVGAAWVFTRTGSTWEQQGSKLTGGGEAGEGRFGFSVALSGEGDTALVGGGADNSAAGAVWVFVRSGTTWEQQGSKLTGSGEVGAGHVGFSVALSGDGNTALAGGVGDNGELGAGWVFTRSGTTWAQQGAKLTASGETALGLVGYSGALSSNGDVALLGGRGDSSGAGAAWVFTRSGTTWTQFQKLAGGGESGAGFFGSGAALSASGETAFVGGPGDSSGSGAAWAFSNAPLPPSVVTGQASGVTGSSATLNATVNPNGQTVTDCHFNWGTTTAYGSTAPCSALPGSGNSPVPVSASVSGLEQNKTYHFQIVATNATGTSEGTDQAFTTPSPPEFGRCVKLPTGQVGRFATATCTTAATLEKHSYEWLSGPGPKTHFTFAIKPLSTALLETTAKQKIVCTGQTGAGEYAGPKTVAGVTLTFTGCELAGAKCTGSGSAEGEVSSSVLAGSLGVVKKSLEGPLKDKIGLDLAAAGEAPVLNFTCGATTVKVSGSVIVPVAINRFVSKATMSFAQTAGKQKPESFEGLPKDVLEATFGEAPPVQIGLKLITVQTDEEKIEISSVV